MKLITLNIWGGLLFKPLMQFIKTQASSTDIFCFQEVFDTSSKRKISHGARVNILQEIKTVLKNFECFYLPAESGLDYHGPVNFDISWGIAIFIKKSVRVIDQGFIQVYKGKQISNGNHHSAMPRNLQYVIIQKRLNKLLVSNLHGYWAPESNKIDTPERLEQSQIIRQFLDQFNGPKILGGDFNLLPGTKSMEFLDQGMINLISLHNITSTRSYHYTKPQKYADYILISPDIKVESFQVLEDVVSNHLPLRLEFN